MTKKFTWLDPISERRASILPAVSSGAAGSPSGAEAEAAGAAAGTRPPFVFSSVASSASSVDIVEPA